MKIHTVKRHSLLGGGNSKFCPILCVFFRPIIVEVFFWYKLSAKKKNFFLGGGYFGFCENTPHEGRTVLMGVN